MIRRTAVAVLLALVTAVPSMAYTIYLKDGSRIIAREKYVIDGERAIITLENGTQTFLAADEIDVARTDSANTSNLGDALIFEDGEFVQRGTKETPKRETLSDLIERGGATVQGPTRSRGETAPLPVGATNIESAQRLPMRDIELAAAMKQALNDSGLTSAVVYQGTEQGRPLVEVVAESEASVFNGLELVSKALLAVRETHPACDVLELLLTTSEHERAGEFELTAAMAQQIEGKQVELPAFYIEHVRF